LNYDLTCFPLSLFKVGVYTVVRERGGARVALWDQRGGWKISNT
jgi:hypothetical protein